MTANFCHHCAAKLVPNAKFCNQCGTSLASLTNTPPAPEPPPQVKRPVKSFTPFVVGDDDDDDNGASRYDRMEHLDIRIDKLEIDVIAPGQKPETLGGIVEAGARFGPGQVEQRGAAKISQKKFMSEWAKEAGALKKD